MLLAAPVTIPLANYYARRIRKTGMLSSPGRSPGVPPTRPSTNSLREEGFDRRYLKTLSGALCAIALLLVATSPAAAG